MIDSQLLREQLNNKIDELWTEQVEFLKTITRFPSLSGKEHRLQLFLADYLSTKLNLQVDRFYPDMERIEKHPGFSPVKWSYEYSDIVIGTKKGANPSEGKTLIFQGHADVVSAEPTIEWETSPWEPVEKDGRLYGRGTADMKGGLSAMIFAYRALIECGYVPNNDFMLQIVPDEERSGNGALAALEAGYTADAALIPEPFGLQPSTGQVGSLWFEISLRTIKKDQINQTQTNVIEKIHMITSALLAFERHLNQTRSHLTFSDQDKPIDLNIGKVTAGDFASNEPIRAKIEGRVALLPGESVAERKQELIEWIMQETKKDAWFIENPPDIEFYGFHAEGTLSNESSELFKELDATHELVTNTQPSRRTLPSTTDARFFQLYYDIDATCYGPVGGHFHEVNEWVDLKSVRDVTKVYANFLANWCGVGEK